MKVFIVWVIIIFGALWLFSSHSDTNQPDASQPTVSDKLDAIQSSINNIPTGYPTPDYSDLKLHCEPNYNGGFDCRAE